MKKENRFIGAVLVLSLAVIILTTVCMKPISVVHNARWYEQELVLDRATVPGLPSADEMKIARDEVNPQILLGRFGQIACAYNLYAHHPAIAGHSRIVAKTVSKHAYYAYLSGILYKESFKDEEKACAMFSVARTEDPSNPLYKRVSSDCPK